MKNDKPASTMRKLNIDEIYDEMAEEYDDIKDLWYGWLCSRLHYKIVHYLYKNSIKGSLSCLDVGCGTGFQSILLSLCGHEVTGIDISSGLISMARQKDVKSYLSRDLFDSPYHFVHQYSERIRELTDRLRGDLPILEPSYKIESAINLSFENESFDMVNCCGSTLSSIEDYKAAMKEMVRVLRPGGTLILEVENKYNPDLLWPIIDTCLGGIIGYEQAMRISLDNAFSGRQNHVKIDFPFSMHRGEILMPIRLFSSNTLLNELESEGIRIQQTHAIHNFTNLIPSTALDRVDPPKWLIRVFNILTGLEVISSSLPLLHKLGCSMVIFGEKR